MKPLFIIIPAIGVVLLSSLTGCKSRNAKTAGVHVENSPVVEAVVEKHEDSVVFVDYTPKTTFTSIEQMEDKIPEEQDGVELGVVNAMFVKGCYYTGDTSTPFLASFAERYNKTEFLRRFVNAEEIFERENTNIGDSLTTDTIRGKMPLLTNEYQLAFRNANCQAWAKKLVRMLTTIDYVPEQTEKMASYFQELVNVPYDTPEFLSDEEREATDKDFWVLYDKSKYVADYDEIQKKRLLEEVDSDELQRLSLSRYRRSILKRRTLMPSASMPSKWAAMISRMPLTTLESLSKMAAIPSICLRCGYPGDFVPSPGSLASRPIQRFQTTCTTMPGSLWPRPM